MKKREKRRGKRKKQKGTRQKNEKKEIFYPFRSTDPKNREKTIFSKRGQYDFDIIYLPIYL